LDNYFKSTTNDYFVGAPFLEGTPTSQGLSQYELNVPVVQFFGVELQPVMWRFMSSNLNIGHDYLDNTQKIFGYNQDDQLQIKVQGMINEFDAKAILEDREIEHQRGIINKAKKSIIYLRQAIAAVDKIKIAQENKHAYVKAKNWLADANEVYQVELLGDKKTQVVMECHLIEELDCYDPNKNPKGFMPPIKLIMEHKYRGTGAFCSGPSIADKYTNYKFPGNDGTIWKGNCEGTQLFLSALKIIHVPLENDGIVLVKSAASRIKVKTGNSHAITIMPETHHDQMKNSEQTRIALNNLYDGILGDFFSIPLR
jgi:hypothetical protein